MCLMLLRVDAGGVNAYKIVVRNAIIIAIGLLCIVIGAIVGYHRYYGK